MELAAAGMVVGAGWAGGRGMTCTSGPGISLMSEFVGLAYFAEVPGVIWDVQAGSGRPQGSANTYPARGPEPPERSEPRRTRSTSSS